MKKQELTAQQKLLIAKIKAKSNAIKNFTQDIENKREKQENKVQEIKAA